MKKIKLDKYEQEIENAIARGEYVSVSKTEFEKTKREFEEMARNYFKMKKKKSITLRVEDVDLMKVKLKARKRGIGYQTIINMLINGYANDRIQLAV